MTKINYQRIYEEALSSTIKESLELPSRFYELPHQTRMMVEELVDFGYHLAVEDALDTEVLTETSALASEMSSQLKGLQNVVDSYLSKINPGDGNYL
tara:strand:- start:1657 stop:1947 length:291 start_codon:yes stop_codon:yes gene_type:complete